MNNATYKALYCIEDRRWDDLEECVKDCKESDKEHIAMWVNSLRAQVEPDHIIHQTMLLAREVISVLDR